MMQVSKKIPFDDPSVLNAVRALYVVSNVLIAGIYFYVKMQIDKKKGTKKPGVFCDKNMQLTGFPLQT